MTVPHVAPNPIQWNFVWSSMSIPKVDLFCWNVVHRSILTTENLRKRGLEGPSRCSLCKKDEENIDHLLLSCTFSKEVWIPMNPPNFNLSDLTADLFTRWADCSPFQLSKKDLLNSAWMLLPKFIFWKLWLERNNRLFRDVESSPSRIAMKAKAFLGEALDHKPDLWNARPLEDREASWFAGFASSAHKTSITRSPTLAAWEI